MDFIGISAFDDDDNDDGGVDDDDDVYLSFGGGAYSVYICVLLYFFTSITFSAPFSF